MYSLVVLRYMYSCILVFSAVLFVLCIPCNVVMLIVSHVLLLLLLVPNWSLSNPAAFDLKVIHPLNTDLILEASLASGNSAEFGEIGKHTKNDQMCGRLGWTCIPLVVEVYGGWGCEAQGCFSRLSKRLAMQVGVCETEALSRMYCLLGITLMRQNALLRCAQTPLQDC